MNNICTRGYLKSYLMILGEKMMKLHLHFCEHDMQNRRYGLFENYNHFQDKTSQPFLFSYFEIKKLGSKRKVEILLFKSNNCNLGEWEHFSLN